MGLKIPGPLGACGFDSHLRHQFAALQHMSSRGLTGALASRFLSVPGLRATRTAHQMFGARIQPHGEEWQLIMRGVYELPPDRCHTYAIRRRVGTRYVYRCSCSDQDFAFTPQRHALVAKGRRYYCRRCKTTLSFTGEQRRE